MTRNLQTTQEGHVNISQERQPLCQLEPISCTYNPHPHPPNLLNRFSVYLPKEERICWISRGFWPKIVGPFFLSCPRKAKSSNILVGGEPKSEFGGEKCKSQVLLQVSQTTSLHGLRRNIEIAEFCDSKSQHKEIFKARLLLSLLSYFWRTSLGAL